MSTVTLIHTPITPIAVWPKDVVPGTLYVTAYDKLAYAVTETVIALFDDPGAYVMMVCKDPKKMDRRFPLRKAPPGTQMTLVAGKETLALPAPLVFPEFA